ncbi:hypothetical protein KIW84_010997 [Lathyrus oleraceus]|uniref:Uncharacterized protein n=1 Tax=Pisum sativum TaxID=3888 RepID=A0A9D4YME7_PEA|nr:hypothetical protein KIW84_010997 [Pisum sativum]
MQRMFTWDDNDDNHHMHTIRWSEIALPKYQGGLGIGKLDLVIKLALRKLSIEAVSHDMDSNEDVDLLGSGEGQGDKILGGCLD